MKKLLLLLCLLPAAFSGFAQNKMSCCAKPDATQRFAMLASNKSFVMAHANPLKMRFQSSVGKSVTYQTPDGKEATGYELKAKSPTNNYLIVVHEWWGLNDYIKRESEKIYNDIGNVNVIDVDLYEGKIATTREEASKLVNAVNEDRAKAIIKGAIAYAGPNAKIATLGWCFGGGWSLQSSLMAGRQAIACIMVCPSRTLVN